MTADQMTGDQMTGDQMAGSSSTGVWLALAAACISGVSVFVNTYATKAVPDPTAFTTLKNLVAAVIVGGLLVVATARGSAAGFTRPRGRRDLVGLGVVAVIGGSVPFVLFFEGLARVSSARDAAFIQKTLVIWVAVLAVVFLHERLGLLQVGAVAALVAGPALLGVDFASLRPTWGEAMILAATLLWAVEVVVAKRLLSHMSPLTVATVRLAGGVVLLVGYVVLSGHATALVPSGSAWGWVLLTGGLLALYVTTWFMALARAQAVDVTAVLVFGAVITAALDAVAKGGAIAPQLAGLALIVAGTVAFVALATRRGGEVSLDPGAGAR